MPVSREEYYSRNTSILHILPQIHLPLECGVMKFRISRLLILLILHTKFGKDWPSDSWEDLNAWRTTDDDWHHPIAIGHLTESGDLKILIDYRMWEMYFQSFHKWRIINLESILMCKWSLHKSIIKLIVVIWKSENAGELMYVQMCAVDKQYVNLLVNKLCSKEIKDKHNIAIEMWGKKHFCFLPPSLFFIFNATLWTYVYNALANDIWNTVNFF